MQRVVTYFEKPGRENTEQCFEIVSRAIHESACKYIVVATTSGSTGLLFAEGLKNKDVRLITVTHSYGFKEPNSIEISREIRERILATGATIYTGTMITHSIETALAKKFSGVYPTLLVAQTLRRFGEGVKVCCEIIMMAADAGLVPEGEEAITVAGTGHGSDTVAIIRAATSKRFLDLKVLEILAKPRG